MTSMASSREAFGSKIEFLTLGKSGEIPWWIGMPKPVKKAVNRTKNNTDPTTSTFENGCMVRTCSVCILI